MEIKKLGNLYIDTDILISLRFELCEDIRWINLKRMLLDPLKIKIFIPQIVLDELLIHRKEELMQELNKLEKAHRRINERVGSKIELRYDRGGLQDELEKRIYKIIKEAGIEIFKISFERINMEEVVKMAVNKIGLFREGDKGFKDMVILLSILEHSKINPNDEHLFLTQNKHDFDSNTVREVIDKAQVKMRLFFSIEDLEVYLGNFVKQLYRDFIIKRENKLKEFLLSPPNREIIQNFINNHYFNESFLKDGFYPFLSIEKIEKIEFVDVLNPIAGFLKQNKEGNVEINFKAQLNFYMIIRRLFLNKELRKFRTGEEPLKISLPAEERKIELVRQPKTVRISGKIHIKKENSKEHFSNLRLEEIIEEESSIVKALTRSHFK